MQINCDLTKHGIKSNGQQALNIVDAILSMDLGVNSEKKLALEYYKVSYTPYEITDNLVLPWFSQLWFLILTLHCTLILYLLVSCLIEPIHLFRHFPMTVKLVNSKLPVVIIISLTVLGKYLHNRLKIFKRI